MNSFTFLIPIGSKTYHFKGLTVYHYGPSVYTGDYAVRGYEISNRLQY